MKPGFRIFRHPSQPWRCGLILAVLAAAAVTLGGCERLSGTFADGEGNSIQFEGGSAYVTFYPAPTMEAAFEVSNDKVIIRATGDAMVLTLNGDTLEGGPFGMTFTRAELQ